MIATPPLVRWAGIEAYVRQNAVTMRPETPAHRNLELDIDQMSLDTLASTATKCAATTVGSADMYAMPADMVRCSSAITAMLSDIRQSSAANGRDSAKIG